MDSPERFFCSNNSVEQMEEQFATASHYAAFILVRYNLPFPEKVADADLPKELLRNLQHYANAHKAKLLLFRSDNELPCLEIVYVDHYKGRYKELLLSPGDLIHFNLEKFLHKNTVDWRTEPFYLVCTNGKKDKCCSLKGFPLYEAFKMLNQPVFQCSHVGGDRFAANVLLMPLAIYYGRVEIVDLDSLIEATGNDEVYLKCYRGRATMNFRRQAAEYYLRSRTKNYSFENIMRVHKEVMRENGLQMTGTFNNLEFNITMQAFKTAPPQYLTCKSAEKECTIRYALKEVEIEED